MDEEKMQRQMEFLLEWQAQFAAKLGELENDSKQTHENIKRTDESVTRLGERLEGGTELLGSEALVYGISREDWLAGRGESKLNP